MWGKKRRKLAIVLTCADWRLHQRKVDLNARLARRLAATGVDLITVPGPDGLIEPERQSEWQTAVSQIKLLIGAHSPAVMAVVAHQRCAGHPVTDGEHDADVVATAKALKEATGFAGPVRAIVAVYHADLAWDLKDAASF
jgi:type II secretory pathway component PulM